MKKFVKRKVAKLIKEGREPEKAYTIAVILYIEKINKNLDTAKKLYKVIAKNNNKL